MPLPKLTPLQSRFLASFVASAILVILYLSLTSPRFAYAVDLDSRIPPDHNHPIILDDGLTFEELELEYEVDDENGDSPYSVVERQGADVNPLANNEASPMNIDAGETQNWVFPKTAVDGPAGDAGPGLPHDNNTEDEQLRATDELRKRQDFKTVYITLTTCLQPSANGTDLAKVPPPLVMYISQSSSNQNPGPTVGDPAQQNVTVTGGFAIATLQADDDVYIGVSASNNTDFSGIYNYEIAASIDAPFHAANNTWPNLFFVDGDNHAALLITNDTTETNNSSPIYQEWMNMRPPYGLYAHNAEDPSILGVQNSYCGLKNYAQIAANLPGVENQNVAGMTNRGLGGKPKEQFYIQSLNASSQYMGFLAMAGNSTAQGNGVVGGGGKVWQAMNFNTKTGKRQCRCQHADVLLNP